MSDVADGIGGDIGYLSAKAAVSVDLKNVETETLGGLVHALRLLKAAQEATADGLASDHMESAAREIRKAMRMVGA